MYVGLPNPNVLTPVKKMRITNLDAKAPPKYFEVLYNPQSYTRQKTVNYKPVALLGADAPVVQFQNGAMETLTFELFFDSISAGSEVGGTMEDKLKFEANSLLPSMETLDVRDYTKKVTDLMYLDSDLHRPPELKVEWASLQFRGFLAKCDQRFVRFNEQGKPVRAYLNCTFIEHREIKKLFVANPLNSPDTTKYRTVRQGDSLWSLAAAEYGDAGQWRVIAAANGIANPRRLRTGETLVVPALV